MTRIKVFYQKKVIKYLKKKLNYKNIMQVPKILKITLNMGIGNAEKDKKKLEYAMKDLALISGQKPLITKAKKSISGFKIREGWKIGCKVTLRNNRMYEFLDRLLNIAIPRIRDFRGLSNKSFDGHGNYNFGIKEQIIFPEIDYDKIDIIRGLNISITTSANNNKECFFLLNALNFPLIKK